MQVIKLYQNKPENYPEDAPWSSSHVALGNQVAVIVKLNFDGKNTHLCKAIEPETEYFAVRINKRILTEEETELHTGQIVEMCHDNLARIESYILFYQAIKEDMQGG